ncbi:MAG: 50S ribosomal protein L16 [Candidatus Micrarchaeia archaeon]|jgi:large subunit ribosomal protein L10e
MARRPAKAYRDPDKVAWTKYSKTKPRRSYIKSMPHRDLNQFRMGIEKEDYDARINLISMQDLIISDNSLESSRQSANKHLEKTVSGNYHLMIKPYPHHVIRENKMIAGAGADRLQKGMRKAFGRPSDRAARIYRGQQIMTIKTYKANIPNIQIAMQRAMRKLSGAYSVQIETEGENI